MNSSAITECLSANPYLCTSDTFSPRPNLVLEHVQLANKFVQGGILAFSMAISLVMGAALGLLHVPFRAERSAVSHFVSATTPATRSWKAVHLLSVNCPCSQAVSAHLLQRGPFPSVGEYVVLAGRNDALAQRLTQAGFHVQSRSAEEIASQFQVPGAPWFILVSPAQKIFYAGGYSADRNAGSGYQDRQIWEEATAGSPRSALPVYGCALSKLLQKKTDPFGLKYKN